jgi:hypothetical protein
MERLSSAERSRVDRMVAQERQITELFTAAVDQLGSDNLENRLGAIYALERIAEDSVRDHWPIMEILATYVRQNAPWPPRAKEPKESTAPASSMKALAGPNSGNTPT